jgi:hypothetical protein
MKGSGQLPPESDKGSGASAEDTKRALRRRILKAGLIGAPVVVTLQSNAAWAASMTCLQNLKVPQDIVTPYQNSHGSLVPYNSTNQNHVGYLHALENDKQHMSGMPGYSCVASIMTHT